MKRKSSEIQDAEDRVSQLLFHKTKKFVENLHTTAEEKDVSCDLKPAWVDEDDENFGANIIPNIKSTGLYTEKLKQKYETLMGTPSWATLNNKGKTDEEDDEILRTVGHLHKKKVTHLPKDFLEIKKFPLINATTKNEGPVVSCVEFHPKVSAALVAGHSGAVSLFSIGTDVNNKLHNFTLKKWRISAAQFSPDGSEAFIASKNNHTYCVYNLVKAEPKLVQLPRAVKKPAIFKLSNDGKYLATSDGFEEVYLICAASKELLKSLKHNSNIASLAFSHDCTQLYCYGVEGQITIWDLSTHRPLKKFYDHGCVTASCLTLSKCGKLLATGSGEGIVNIYQTENLNIPEPVPSKVISNLTTKITNLNFNSTTEILSASSAYYPNAVKLVHIPSYHVFVNFPCPKLNHHQIDTINFSRVRTFPRTLHACVSCTARHVASRLRLRRRRC